MPLVILVAAGAVWGQNAKNSVADKQLAKVKTTTPKKASAGGQKTKLKTSECFVTVESVTGSASRRSTSESKSTWVPVKHGDKLDEFTLIRTGLGSHVVIVFEDRAKFTIKAASKIGIATVRKSNGVYRAKLGLKYGAMKASIDRSKGANDFRVATPVGALAVRGSKANFAFSSDRGFGIHSNQSTWNVKTKTKRSRNVPTGGRTNTNLDSTSQIATRKLNTHVGDPFGGLTPEEQYWLNVNGGGRGIFDFTGSNNDFGSLFSLLPRSCSVSNGESESLNLIVSE